MAEDQNNTAGQVKVPEGGAAAEMPASMKATLESSATPDFTHKTKEGVEVSVTFPRVLIEILAYGKQSREEEFKGRLKALTKVIDDPRFFNYCRILYCMVGEDEEYQKKWLLDNAKCKYYVFINEETFKFHPDFIKELFKRIRRVENAIQHAQRYGIQRHPKIVPPKPNEPEMKELPEGEGEDETTG